MTRAERKAASSRHAIPLGVEAGHDKSCGLAMPAEAQQRGLQGRSMYSSDEGLA